MIPIKTYVLFKKKNLCVVQSLVIHFLSFLGSVSSKKGIHQTSFVIPIILLLKCLLLCN